jgi:regulator of ribonuclease activity A
MTTFRTADLCDRFAGTQNIQISEPIFKPYGRVPSFSGPISTLKVFEDDVLLRDTLAQKAEGRILAIDGGGSHRCALIDANAARLAAANGWAGLIVYGCVRDSLALGDIPIGIRALHTHPHCPHHRGGGERDSVVTFSGVNYKTGHFVYADEDGIVVSETNLV